MVSKLVVNVMNKPKSHQFYTVIVKFSDGVRCIFIKPMFALT